LRMPFLCSVCHLVSNLSPVTTLCDGLSRTDRTNCTVYKRKRALPTARPFYYSLFYESYAVPGEAPATSTGSAKRRLTWPASCRSRILPTSVWVRIPATPPWSSTTRTRLTVFSCIMPIAA